MKRIRIAAGLMLSAALMTISFGTHVASGHEADRVAFDLSESFCGNLGELLVDDDVMSSGADYSSVRIEVVGSTRLRSPVSPWLILEPTVESWKCDGPGTLTVPTDIASTP